MNKVIKAALTSLIFLATIACSEEAKEISIVKKGKVSYCPNFTMEEIVNSLIDKPKWKYSAGYVNASGITASGKPANVVMQFWVRNNGEWDMQAFEVDGKPQQFAGLVIIELCKEAASKRAKIEQEAEKERLSKVRVTPAEPLNDSRDGKKYKTVKIGSQTWMAENLDIKIGNSKCYENKEDNCKKYGRLYDWKTAVKSCPKYGWHLPSTDEWNVLIKIAGDKTKSLNDAGKYLKAKSGWNSGNGEDKFGFSALPGGSGRAGYSKVEPILGKSIHYDDEFYKAGEVGSWWSASEFDSEYANVWHMNDISESASYEENEYKSYLLSVRCVQDTETGQKSVVNNETQVTSESQKLTDSNDDKKYKTVKIGSQTWMAENLDIKIGNSKCYENKEDNCKKYGRLYDWKTAMKACPNGWHLPNNKEWDKLFRSVDGSNGTSSPYESETAGKYLKAKNGWNNNGNGEDKFSFAALPGGLGNYDGSFSGVGDFGYWWDASEHNAKNAYRRSILNYDERAYWRQGSKSGFLLSVRCVQD
jgi:uncharacterized protein (TIGR02145 family)